MSALLVDILMYGVPTVVGIGALALANKVFRRKHHDKSNEGYGGFPPPKDDDRPKPKENK